MSEDFLKNIRIADFNYPLPDERIARHPLADRDRCLLLLSKPDGSVEDHRFYQLPELIAGKGLMVFNNTKVIHARIPFRRPTGAAIEVFLLEPLKPEDYVLVFQSTDSCEWACMVGNLKKWKEPSLERRLVLADGSEVTLTAELGEQLEGNARRIRFSWENRAVTFASIVEAAGRIPIPPYLKRDSEDSDEEDYQTVYSKIQGSVAAPTAGLHFTPALLEELQSRGQHLAEVTLHVGAGTFQPVKSERIGDHPMHTETFTVTLPMLRELREGMERSRSEEDFLITAVGTTSVRTLETLPYIGRKVGNLPEGETPDASRLHLGQWEAYESPIGYEEAPQMVGKLIKYLEDKGLERLTASTAIMIAPGFGWNVVGRMVTNFHQPSSTLLLLVSSFLDRSITGGDLQWRRIYNHALEGDYRFLSYGDACLLYPRKG